MAKIRFDGPVGGFSGRMGNLVFRQMGDGSTRVSQAPRQRNTGASEKQLEHRQRFKEAISYARLAAKEQPVYAELAARHSTKTAHNLAVADWMNPPVIDCIHRMGDQLLVRANDDVLVTRVRVTVLDDEGQILEQGEAVQSGRDWWVFTPGSEGKSILAEAWDLPGHATTFTI